MAKSFKHQTKFQAKQEGKNVLNAFDIQPRKKEFNPKHEKGLNLSMIRTMEDARNLQLF